LNDRAVDFAYGAAKDACPLGVIAARGKEPVLNLNTNHQSTAWSLSTSGVGALPANPVELERAANAARATNRIAERILMERTIASFACVHPKLSEVIFRIVTP
jgi:hypothetical protein